MSFVRIEGRSAGVHALIIGVSDYWYLPGDDDPVEGGVKLGMKKLKTPALGAFRLLKWLQKADPAADATQWCGSLVSWLVMTSFSRLRPRIGPSRVWLIGSGRYNR
jgi:hypothetical protein